MSISVYGSASCGDFVFWDYMNEIRCVHLRFGAMEEEAVRCDEVLAEGEVLGVPSTPFHCACHSSHSS